MAGMTWEIEFGGDPEDVLATSHGTASVEGLHAVISEIVSSPSFRPGMWIVFDETDLDWSAMSTSDLRRRADFVEGYLEVAGDVRVVVVSPTPVGLGIHRQVEAYAGGFEFDMTVVPTLEEARAWLGPRTS
jgi:hypothetical protein